MVCLVSIWRVLFEKIGAWIALSFIILLFFSSNAFSQLVGETLGDFKNAYGLSAKLNPSGQPAFGYFDSSTKRLVFTEQLSTGFKSEIVDRTVTVMSDTALVFRGRSPYLFYAPDNTGVLYVAYRSNGIWTKSIVSSSLAVSGMISATTCGSSVCAVVYGSSRRQPYLIQGWQNTWTVQIIDNAFDDCGTHNAIASDANGRLVVAYFNNTKKRLVVAEKRANSSWSVETLNYLNHSLGKYPSISIDSSGTLYVSASRVLPSSMNQDMSFYYGKKSLGGAWELSEALSSYMGGSTAISVSNLGKVLISARQLRNSSIYGNAASTILADLLPTGYWSASEYVGNYSGESLLYDYSNIHLEHDKWGNPVLAFIFSRGAFQSSGAISPVRLYRSVDTDKDGIPDSKESQYGTSANKADTDGDGLIDGLEVLFYSTNPRVSDSDGDGYRDGVDNCPNISNANQLDSDSNGYGDLCPQFYNETPLGSPSSDADGDGVINSQEGEMGTDPLDADTDGDDVDDGQELLDGTNPLDRGSAQVVLGNKLCMEWNGFLGGMHNILELVNLSAGSIIVESVLYNINGDSMSSNKVRIKSGAQSDMLVHDMDGRALNSYGMICAFHNGAQGDIDGRMVYYKQNGLGGFEFAFAMPASNGITGNQYVPFNTFQPSLSPVEQANLVSNWIQITNLSSHNVSGSLLSYGQDGSQLWSKDVSLEAGARRDFPAHSVGASKVGFVAWKPDDASSVVQLRNVRYVYDNAQGVDSFTTAFQISGMVGSGELLSVPLTTKGESSILEITNTTDASIKVAVSIFDANGNELQVFNLKLGARKSQHLIIDGILGANNIGSARIIGDAPESIIAVAMHYGRRIDGGIDYMYGIPAQEALGSVLRGSYNTFLDQQSELILHNPTTSEQKVLFYLTRSDGTELLKSSATIDASGQTGELLTISEHGTVSINLNQYEMANNYGVVNIIPDNQNTIVSWVTRHRGTDYVMPTPVRQ